jgi:hypothetical protein
VCQKLGNIKLYDNPFRGLELLHADRQTSGLGNTGRRIVATSPFEDIKNSILSIKCNIKKPDFVKFMGLNISRSFVELITVAEVCE